jgi:ABC-type bacteriocin/lantibiotic exporter with double-glycine peptidase domain
MAVHFSSGCTAHPSIEVKRHGPAHLNMGIFEFKFTMNFLMNLCSHLQVSAALFGGWWILEDKLEIGGIVAFISAVGRRNDPWGDLANHFRDLSTPEVKFNLLTGVVGTASS